MTSRINILKILKISGGALLSIIIAQKIGLGYGSSAGVIALLSIHDTKRETIRMMGKRLAAFLLALALAPACFYLAGFRPLAIGVFLLLFTPVCALLELQEGISVSTVLMTHFLSEGSMSAGNIFNEALLLLIGTSVGVAMNLYIPGKRERIRQKQRQIETQFRYLFACMSDVLAGRLQEKEYKAGLHSLAQMIEEGERDAYNHMENNLLTETKYYIRYMEMRKNQLSILLRIQVLLERPGIFWEQARWLTGLFRSISESFHEFNNALALLKELEGVKEKMKRQPLPKSREEVESLSSLFQIVVELEQFLLLKREFVKDLSRRELETFWNS